ncbi:MAG: chorismate synthase [Oscillospiraceae bacterium]|nr:chorismate synthase [Oscillospiraceae bacterium]
MNSTYGDILKLTIFGQSHGAAIGMTLDGIPAGLPVDFEELQAFLNRRAPGKADYATSRKEPDCPEFLSGIESGYTCGAPIAAIIRNTNTRSADYSQLKDIPRPGHADYTAQVKYNGYQDIAGGGHFSGRLTAPLCIAGGLCKQWLLMRNIRVDAHISAIGSVEDSPARFDSVHPQINHIAADFPVLNPDSGRKMQERIAELKAEGDSTGGIVECAITGLPAGIGEPMFGGMEGKIAQIIYGIPAVKGIEFGAGFDVASLTGSTNNDSYTIENGKIRTKTNNAGGILGGITNGMPLIFRAAIKPTPSIAKEQDSVSISRVEACKLTIQGRHDPCIVPRAVPVIEAAAAIAVFDAILRSNSKWI